MHRLRELMVTHQLIARDITDSRVIEAMKAIERHKFVPPESTDAAYEDHPLPIGHGQTISQPYIVALMSQLCKFAGKEKVLEIGTGCGYQTAILSYLAKKVYTIEIIEQLATSASIRFKELGYTNITTLCGDGYLGWPENLLFDVIILTASPPQIPQKIIDQLAPGGILVAPEGDIMQELITITKKKGTIKRKTITYVRFVPMIHSE